MRRARTSLKKLANMTAVLAFAGLTAACQYQSAEDLLFKPTRDPRNIPRTYDTPFDCRNFVGSGWRGTAAGKTFDFERTLSTSRVGCFKTRDECQAFLYFMNGQIDQIIYSRCEAI
ncbi:MAG: hypothetical protein JJ902_15660 [Roseibium sp.]|nr:hypothetical protein [Roseibium sp.]